MSCPHPVSISHLRLCSVRAGAAGGPLNLRLAAHGTTYGLTRRPPPAGGLESVGGNRADTGTTTGELPAGGLVLAAELCEYRVVLTQGTAFSFFFFGAFALGVAAALQTAGSCE